MKTKLLATILVILGIALLTQNLYYNYLENPADATNTEKVSFLIKKGETAETVADKLVENNLIKSKLAFKFKIRRQADKIIAGRFYLSQSMTIPEIITTITNVKNAESILTIQEGLTISDIDKKLVEMDLTIPGEFIEAVKSFDSYEKYPFLNQETLKKLKIPLEGYLFPDTYFLDTSGDVSKSLIEKCLRNFDQKLPSKPENLHEIITMASIIEQEVRTPDDLPIVSGILWKRYKSNWHIGADATLLYITDDRKITTEDLEIDSPYNTRKVVGIPPGPIGNPGLASIKAALDPEESPYWYYLTTLDTGEVIYAETNDEHNINKAKYLY